ncbi:MAG TPA: PAS domain S-box protein [Candidatus Sulfopaludibacter sp.]|jgi:PAS domain S-box-containing protein|nr:PAS domain S-box protein [Candidatus Sulfopaludibacter sp.]
MSPSLQFDSYRRRFSGLHGSESRLSELSEAEERLALMAAATGDAVWDYDLDTHTVWWNEVHEKLYGRNGSAAASPDWWIERIHPEDQAAAVGALEVALASGADLWQGEYRFRDQNGSYLMIRDRTRISRRDDGSPRRLTSAKTDITEQRHMEAQLRDTTSILQSFYESVPTCMGLAEVLDNDFEVIHANRASCAILKVRPEEARGSRFGVCGMPADILKEWLARARETQATGLPVRFEYFSSLSQRWFGVSIGAVAPGESGRPRLIFSAEDVTAYKRTQEERRDAEERFRRLYESNIIGIVTGDEEYLLDANDVFLQMVGYTRADLDNGKIRWWDLTAPEYRHLGPQTVADVKRTGSAGPFEKEYLRKDGSRISALLGSIRLQDEPYRDFSFVLDLTERKRLERRVLDAQKFESVGVLAGGIAHDFNNILVGVIGHASLAQDLLPPVHPARDLLAQVVKNGEQAAHLTRQMLAYSGKGRFLLEPLNLSTLFDEISILVKPAIDKDIELEMILPDDLPAVEADRGQMRQVFTNLVLNAAESIVGKGGRIHVETGVCEIDSRQQQTDWVAGEVQPGKYVFLEVVDNGCGLDEATRSRIFDPFFTTKFVGRGLGLAAVAGIVRGHKGAITVSSELGKGSRFLTLFPASSDPACARAAHVAASQRPAGTVLVVDDEAVVRQMARAALERHGYAVAVADSGLHAIELLQQNPARYSLILLDLSMPGMTGVQTLPALRRARPEIPVLITSGYSEAQTLSLFAGQNVSGFLQKPFTSQVLITKIGDALGSA